ncbi:uncharacterized protein LOC144449089 [Glandiceps talaboti]
MAFWRRRSQAFEPNPPETKYMVQYLGKMPANGKMGLECTMKPVELMYRTFKFNKGKNYQRLMIEVTNKGVSMNETGPTGHEILKDRFIPIYKLSFGAADPVHTRVFSFVRKNDDTESENPWECHAFLCETTSVAKALTLYLVKAFQKAADAWEAKHGGKSGHSKPRTMHITHEKGKLEHQTAEKKYQPPVSTVKITFNIDNVDEFDRVGDSPNKNGGQKDTVENNRAFAAALASRDTPEDGEGSDQEEKGNESTDKKTESTTANEENVKEGEVVAAFNPQVLLHPAPLSPAAASSSPSANKLRKQRSLEKEKSKSKLSQDNNPVETDTNEPTDDDSVTMRDHNGESEFSRAKKKSVRFSGSDSTIPEVQWADGDMGDDDVIEDNTGNTKKSKSSSKGFLNGIANLKFGKSKK